MNRHTRKGQSLAKFRRELPGARAAVERALSGRSAGVAGAATLEVAVATAKAVGAPLGAFLEHVRQVWANPLPAVAASVATVERDDDDGTLQ